MEPYPSQNKIMFFHKHALIIVLLIINRSVLDNRPNPEKMCETILLEEQLIEMT